MTLDNTAVSTADTNTTTVTKPGNQDNQETAVKYIPTVQVKILRKGP